MIILDMPRNSDDIRRLIASLLDAGVKQKEVARMLEINHNTVHYMWKKYSNIGSVDDKKRSARPMISTERDQRKLCKYSKNNHFSTAIDAEVAVDCLNAASISTIKNYLNESGLFGRVAAKKPILSKVNIKKRITWCKDYRSLSIDEWKNVLFTDECKIEIFSTHRKFVRHPFGQRFNQIQCRPYVMITPLIFAQNEEIWN